MGRALETLRRRQKALKKSVQKDTYKIVKSRPLNHKQFLSEKMNTFFHYVLILSVVSVNALTTTTARRNRNKLRQKLGTLKQEFKVQKSEIEKLQLRLSEMDQKVSSLAHDETIRTIRGVKRTVHRNSLAISENKKMFNRIMEQNKMIAELQKRIDGQNDNKQANLNKGHDIEGSGYRKNHL